MQPYSQPFFWVITTTVTINSMRYWFNGLPLPGTKIGARDAGTTKYWFNGLPCPVLKAG